MTSLPKVPTHGGTPVPGSETAKALANFGPGRTPPELVRAYAQVKKAALLAVQETEKRWSEPAFACLIRAIDEVIAGALDESFVLPLRQGGAGTSLNMNLNEVVAHRANELSAEWRANHATEGADANTGDPASASFHPIDDVNRYQSTNDTFPSAATVLFLRRIDLLEKQVVAFQNRLKDFENAHGALMILGRTEMQDALPMTLSQLSAAWTGAAERDRWRIHKIRERFRCVPLGGTAVGTSYPATRDYVFAAERRLREVTGLNLSRSQSFSDDISRLDKYAELAGVIKTLGGNLLRLCTDLFLHGSSLAGEILHPEAQFGSTIMAAKTNPVFLEYASGLAVDAQFDCDKAARFADMGVFQLNPYLPFACQALLAAFDSVGMALETLDQKFFPGLRVDRDRIEANLFSSPASFNLLLPALGYDGVKDLYRKSAGKRFAGRKEFAEFISAHTELSREELNALLEPAAACSARGKAL